MSEHPVRERIERAFALADESNAASVFTLRLDEAARGAAAAADATRDFGSPSHFFGVPITVKDNFELFGYPTTAGSVILRDAPAAEADAVVAARLRQNGFILLGRTNMTEFAFSGLGLNPHYGTPVNPAFSSEERIPGGSSSGAAVSVALGIASVAIGTDTGGSIRIPAALCGVTGFKPTADAISRRGVLPLSTTLDAVGIVGRTVGDCAAVFDVIRDRPRPRIRGTSASRLRIGLITNYVTEALDQSTAQAFARAVSRLSSAGVAIESVILPELDLIPEMVAEATFPGAEAFAWHEKLLARSGEYDPLVLERIKAGGRMTAAAYVRLIDARRTLIEAVAAHTSGLDVLLWPTVPVVAPTIAELGDASAYRAANALMLRNPSIVNLLDGCAFSIPCPGTDAPVGLSLSAPRGEDDRLVAAAVLVESILKGADDASY